jgi:hypothetical protein
MVAAGRASPCSVSERRSPAARESRRRGREAGTRPRRFRSRIALPPRPIPELRGGAESG